MRMRNRIVCAAMIGTGIWTAALETVAAQDRAAQGHALARQWCTSCHMVEPGGATGSDVAPPFPQIAQDKRLTPGQLRAWLADPHPPMPNLSLTRDEIENLVAYISSLRTVK